MLSNLSGAATASGDSVKDNLAAIRRHLGMDVAYISEFVDGMSVFRAVDAPGLENMIGVGEKISLDDVYCRHILEGRIPQLMRNASDNDTARALPITAGLPVGAHMSVPIRSADGEVLGMFCCLSRQANDTLNDRDLQVMRLFADITGRQVADRIQTERHGRQLRGDIRSIIDEKAFSFVFQPICEFIHRRPIGFEALCRFRREPYRTPDLWFADAERVGLGVELELSAIAEAVKALDVMPERVFLAVNASPNTVLSGRLVALLAGIPPNRLVLEVTEHAPVDDYGELAGALLPLRRAGIRLAIDDAGAGFASLQHILSLQPDRIKLDASLTRSIDSDPARRALASAFVFFAAETGATIVAEGIETEQEFEALRALGIPKGQGYFLGRPTTLELALAMLDDPEAAAHS